MKRRIQAADSIRFYVRGRGAQRLLGQAAQAGLKLERIAPQADGFTAVMSGAGWAKLCQLAGAGGWQVIQMQRRGPGPLAERLLRRPGILAGIGLFFVLLHWLGGFLCIARKDIAELYEYCIESGKEVYLISDMYYTLQDIKRLLDKCGLSVIDDRHIWISCEKR